MSDSYFDADRNSGKYPPKGWGWKAAKSKKELLERHFAGGGEVLPWMVQECLNLGVPYPRPAKDSK